MRGKSSAQSLLDIDDQTSQRMYELGEVYRPEPMGQTWEHCNAVIFGALIEGSGGNLQYRRQPFHHVHLHLNCPPSADMSKRLLVFVEGEASIQKSRSWDYEEGLRQIDSGKALAEVVRGCGNRGVDRLRHVGEECDVLHQAVSSLS